MPSTSRLRAVVSGVTPQPAAVTTTTVEPPAVDAIDIAAPQLLTAEQLRTFVATGYIALPIETLPKEFHEQFFAVTEELKRSGAGGPRGGGGRRGEGGVLEEAMHAVLHSKITRGALTSILGPDFVGSASGGGSGGGSNDSDQGYHKDNSSNCAVRDTWNRQISMFYYPGEVKYEDGPVSPFAIRRCL